MPYNAFCRTHTENIGDKRGLWTKKLQKQTGPRTYDFKQRRAMVAKKP